MQGTVNILLYHTHSRVVILTDLSNCYKRLGVLVWCIWINIVQRGRFGWVTVATGEVDAHREVDLTATQNVVQEGVHLCHSLNRMKSKRQRKTLSMLLCLTN